MNSYTLFRRVLIHHAYVSNTTFVARYTHTCSYERTRSSPIYRSRVPACRLDAFSNKMSARGRRRRRCAAAAARRRIARIAMRVVDAIARRAPADEHGPRVAAYGSRRVAERSSAKRPRAAPSSHSVRPGKARHSGGIRGGLCDRGPVAQSSVCARAMRELHARLIICTVLLAAVVSVRADRATTNFDFDVRASCALRRATS
jgi:hypothetical protein